jgi:SAM-dependent methyltransferase
MEHTDIVPRYLVGPGVEIGAFKTPIPLISPVYVDRFSTYAGEPTMADYFGDACDLPFHDDSVNYVASSHLLEHVANPLEALKEWTRAIRHGGYIYMVIPDRRFTFDSRRSVTEPAHMLHDFRAGVNQVDGTHIDDFVFGIDWNTFSPGTALNDRDEARSSLAKTYRSSVEAGLEINIHFHTFEPESATELIEIGNRECIWHGRLEIREVVERFPSSNPNGFLIVAKVRKGLRHRIRATFAGKGLKPDAKRMKTEPNQTLEATA